MKVTYLAPALLTIERDKGGLYGVSAQPNAPAWKCTHLLMDDFGDLVSPRWDRLFFSRHGVLYFDHYSRPIYSDLT